LQPRGAISTTSAHGRALKRCRRAPARRAHTISTTSAHGRALKQLEVLVGRNAAWISTTSAHGRALKQSKHESRASTRLYFNHIGSR